MLGIKHILLLVFFLAWEETQISVTAQSVTLGSLFASPEKKEIEQLLQQAEPALQTNPAHAQRLLLKVWRLQQTHHFAQFWGPYHYLKGRQALLNQESQLATQHLLAALSAFQRNRDKWNQARVLLELGTIFMHALNFQKALEYFQLGLNYLKPYKESGSELSMQFYTSIGRCNTGLKRLLVADEHLRQAETIARRLQLKAPLATILYWQAINDLEQRKYTFAQELLLEAYKLAHQGQFLRLEMHILDKLSRTSIQLNQIEDARRYGLGKKLIAEQLNDPYCQHIGHYLIAQAYLIGHQLDSAYWFNQAALAGTLSLNKDTLMRDIWEQRGAILSQQGQPLAAVEALEKAADWDAKIATNTELFKIEQQQHELTLHGVEQALHQDFERQFQRERMIRYSLFFSVLFTAGLCFFWLFKTKIRQKANQQLKAQNEQIEAQANQLAQLSQVKDQLFAIISHDLRSPLLAIQEVLDTLHEPDVTAHDRQRWFNLLHQHTAKTSVMLENLLYWANIQMNHYQSEPEEVLLGPIIDEISENLKLIYAHKGVQIDNQVPEGFSMRRDPGMLRMALRNILTNAVKFSHEGASVQVGAVRTEAGVSIEIQDHGIGMSPEQLEKALQGQLSRFGTKGEVGSGIGLSLVRQFVEKNGGRLMGKAAPHEGCTFTIFLPSCRQKVNA